MTDRQTDRQKDRKVAPEPSNTCTGRNRPPGNPVLQPENGAKDFYTAAKPKYQLELQCVTYNN